MMWQFWHIEYTLLLPLSHSSKKKKKMLMIQGVYLECMHAKSLQSCPTLQPHGLEPARLLCLWDFPARTQEWVAMPSSKGSS